MWGMVSGKYAGRKPKRGKQKMMDVLKGRYTLKEVIGQGAFGVTYHAWDEKNHRDAAIKIWKEGEETGLFQREDRFFMEEGRIPGLVKLYDFFSKAGMNFLVMEYLTGGTLKEYLCRNPKKNFSSREVGELFGPVMEALGRLHAEGIVHCDISPDNLMFDQQGKLYLIDLGACRGEAISCEKKFLKEPYSGPEQYAGQDRIGPWTDVYEVCALLYEVLGGQKPPSAPERMQKDELQPLSFYAEVDKQMEKAVMKGLELEIRKRFFSMELLMEALGMGNEELRLRGGSLRYFWGQKWIVVSTEGGSFQLREHKKISRRLWKLALAGLAGIAAAVGLGAAVWNWYETTYQELWIKRAVLQAQKEDPGKNDGIQLTNESENYDRILKELEALGSVSEKRVGDSYTYITYEADREALLEWGVPCSSGRKMYLDAEAIQRGLFYYMDIGSEAVLEEESEEYTGWISRYISGDYEEIHNGIYVKKSCSVLFQGEFRESYRINYDPVDQRVISLSLSTKNKERAGEFLVKMLPICCPEGYVTDAEAEELLEKQDGEKEFESREYAVNARTWIGISFSDYSDSGETEYSVTLASSNAGLRFS